jgi:hypothetical protein
MIDIYKLKDVGECADYLSAKDWKYQGVKSQNADGSFDVAWGYNVIEGTGKATAWIQYSINGLIYQCQQAEFNKLKKRVGELKLKKLKSGIDDEGSIYTLYANKEILLSMVVDKDGIHRIMMFPNEDKTTHN